MNYTTTLFTLATHTNDVYNIDTLRSTIDYPNKTIVLCFAECLVPRNEVENSTQGSRFSELFIRRYDSALNLLQQTTYQGCYVQFHDMQDGKHMFRFVYANKQEQ